MPTLRMDTGWRQSCEHEKPCAVHDWGVVDRPVFTHCRCIVARSTLACIHSGGACIATIDCPDSAALMTQTRKVLHPIPPPPGTLPRRSRRALPPYRYVPGLMAHPFRHEGGHMYTDGTAPVHAPWDHRVDWSTDPTAMFAADLFDHRYFWEAHEAWEAMWHGCPRPSVDRDVLQSLIQTAAALLQTHIGAHRSAKMLLDRARDRMDQAGVSHHRGIDLCGLFDDTERFFRTGTYPLLKSGRAP